MEDIGTMHFNFIFLRIAPQTIADGRMSANHATSRACFIEYISCLAFRDRYPDGAYCILFYLLKYDYFPDKT